MVMNRLVCTVYVFVDVNVNKIICHAANVSSVVYTSSESLDSNDGAGCHSLAVV